MIVNNKLWAPFICATMMVSSSCTTGGAFGNSKFGKIVDAGLNKIEAGVDTVVGKFSGNGGEVQKKIMEKATSAVAPVYGVVGKAVKNGVDPRNKHFNKELNSALNQIGRSYGPEVKAIASAYVTNTFDAKHAAEKGLPLDKKARELKARGIALEAVTKHYVTEAAKGKFVDMAGKALKGAVIVQFPPAALLLKGLDDGAIPKLKF